MRVHVALTPAEASGLALDGWAAIAVDVLRATTTVVAACAAGCVRIIPVSDSGAARERAALFTAGEVLMAGERGGEPIPGFHLGNSPLEFTPERVRGRTILLTTTNGTAAMLGAGSAGAGAVAALTNVSAVARWALAQGRDLAVLCSGDDGSFSLEDAVCAGLLVSDVASACDAELSDAAVAAVGLGRYYATRIGDLRHASRWARRPGGLSMTGLQRFLSVLTIGIGLLIASRGLRQPAHPEKFSAPGSPPRSNAPARTMVKMPSPA